MRPVNDINLHIGDKVYKFAPERAKPADMPYLLQLFVVLVSAARLGPFETKRYVDEHDLWHCFKEQ